MSESRSELLGVRVELHVHFISMVQLTLGGPKIHYDNDRRGQDMKELHVFRSRSCAFSAVRKPFKQEQPARRQVE